MRYYLFHRQGEYYILPAKPIGILSLAIMNGAMSIASVRSSSPESAFHHLILVAILHSLTAGIHEK